MMDSDQITYILKYHGNLKTDLERRASKHASSMEKLGYKIKLIKEQGGVSEKQIVDDKRWNYERGFMTKDHEVLNLLKDGIGQFYRNVAERIDKENRLPYNRCPNCGKLARTPFAKQCRFCFHDWH